MKQKQTHDLVLISMLIAVEMVLMFTPLGYIPLGVIRATTLHIPVILAAIILGYRGGIILGLVFGITSILINTFAPTATSFVFSPFYRVGEFSGGFPSLLIALVPRMMIGVVSAFVYEKLSTKLPHTLTASIASICGALTSTVLVLSGIYLFFGESYAAVRNIPYQTLISVLMSIVFTNGIMEAILAAAIVTPLSRILRPRKEHPWNLKSKKTS